MTCEFLSVIHEDADLLVVNKPAGLVCHPTKTDEYSSLIGRVRMYLGAAPAPQLINRLDRETSGVVLLARNLQAARELRRIWENRQVKKEYWAIVHGHVAFAGGVIDAALGKDEQSKVAIKDCVRLDGIPASTEYRVVRRFERHLAGQASSGELAAFTLLRLWPRTGRKHQIRIHLASIGHPIVGDKIYGGDEDLYLALVEDRLTQEQRRHLILPHHALHAAALHLSWRELAREFVAAPEPWFSEFCPGMLPMRDGVA